MNTLHAVLIAALSVLVAVHGCKIKETEQRINALESVVQK